MEPRQLVNMQKANKEFGKTSTASAPLYAIRPFAHSPIYFFIFLFFLISACYEPRDGCLEIEATNFDASADKNCCCTYPALKLTMLPRFDTLVWKPDTAYEYLPGQWFRLKQAVFYLSDFQLQQQGQTILTSDTVNLSLWGAAGDTVKQTFVNDVKLFRRTVVGYTIGTFRPSGTFESIQFQLGLPDAVQKVIPGLTPEGHPLRLQSENLWLGRDTGFVALKLVLTRDTFSATIPDTLLFSKPDFKGLVFHQNGAFAHESGYDFKLNLTVDYREMFRNVDLSTGDKLAWKTQIVVNLPKVFRVTQ